MIEYLTRAFKQIARFWGRNVFTIAGTTVMVTIATMLLSLSLQLDNLFEQKDLEQLRKFQYINVSLNGRTADERVTKEIKEVNGVEKFLPLTNSFWRYPWTKMTINQFSILPTFITYYDPNYYNDFFNGDFVIKKTMESGIVATSEFRLNMLSDEQFKKIFGIDQLRSTDQMDTTINRMIAEYQKMDLPLTEEIRRIPLVNEKITVTLEAKFLESISSDKENKLLISTEIKPDYYPTLRRNHILVPGIFIQKFTGSNSSKPIKYDHLYLKADSIEVVPEIVEKLKAMGYSTYTNIESLQRHLKEDSKMLLNLMVIMAISLLIAVLSYMNTMQSIIQERRQEFALMKALGATSQQLIFSVVLEGLVLAFFSLFFGLTIVTLLFKGLIFIVEAGMISMSYFEAFQLEKTSVLFLLQVPIQAYFMVTIATFFLGFIVSFLPARQMFNKAYSKLVERG